MGRYDHIQIPIGGNPLSVSQYGKPVRDSIVDLDSRLARVESTISNYAFKASSTTRANTATLADDPEMKLWLDANSKYFVEVFLSAGALAAADIKTAWSVPAGVTGGKRVLGPATGSTVNASADNATVRMGAHNFGTEIVYNGIRDGGGSYFNAMEHAIVQTVGTAGYVTLQWAQATANATGSQLAQDSFMRASKLL